MKFEEFKVKVPNAKKVMEKVNKYEEAFKNAQNAKEAKKIIDKANKYLEDISSDVSVIQIHFSIDTRDEKIRKAYEKVNNTMPLVSEAINELNKAMAASKFRPELEEMYGKHLFEMIDNSLKTFKPEIIPDMIKENELVMQYESILGGAQIEFRGNTYNLSQMSKFKTDLDRETRREASLATDKWGDEHAEEMENIYGELVKVRDSMAKKLGFKNYIEVAYLNLGRLDYNAEMVKKYRDQLYEEVVPLATSLYKRQKRRLGYKKMHYYDWALDFLSGNPLPNGDEPVLVENAQKMYDEMSDVTGEFMHFMRDNHLLDLTAKPGKQPGGYMSYIPKYKSPFIFSNFNGTSGDVDVLTHEFGHALQAYLTRNVKVGDYRSPGLEACEIHSMSMEFLAWPWMNLFFDDADKYRFAHLEGAVLFLPYGASVDEFQHWVYENVNATNKEREDKWNEIDKKYRPMLDNSESSFYGRGRRWLLQGHIFSTPFYYIDYTLAQVCAFQFLVESQKNRDKAWKKYLKYSKLGGKYPFITLLNKAHIKVPFEEGNLKKIIRPVKKILNSFDDSKF